MKRSPWSCMPPRTTNEYRIFVVVLVGLMIMAMSWHDRGAISEANDRREEKTVEAPMSGLSVEACSMASWTEQRRRSGLLPLR